MNKNTILIIDDDLAARRIMKKIIQGNTLYNVIEADDGHEALGKVYEADVILLDVFMPIMNGIEFYRIIQQMEIIKDIPVIFLTFENSKPLNGYLENTLHAAFIKKPIDKALLLESIAQMKTGNDTPDFVGFSEEKKCREDFEPIAY